jgi:uncharacterized protein (DUF427 family)
MPRALLGDTVIAESDDTVVVEGNHYFPRTAVRAEFLEDSATTTFCPWKGTASYHAVVVDGQRAGDAAWFYPEPKPEAAAIKDHVAFWKGVRIED